MADDQQIGRLGQLQEGAHRVAAATRPMAAGFNLNARRSDGTELPVDISLSPVQVGDVVWVSAAIRDATARMAAEDALRRANDQLTATVGALERRGREMALINEMGDLFQTRRREVPPRA